MITNLPVYYPVLDHGFVGLVDMMGSDKDIENAARVSYGKGTRKVSETTQLLRYLYRNEHMSPFEMVSYKFHIAMPIFVARQFVRHRTAKMNEYSGRYSEMPETFYVPELDDICRQSDDNKQGRAGTRIENAEEYQDEFDILAANAFASYRGLVDDGIARELARIVLPLSSYTVFYWKMDLRNLLHLIGLRADGHAQKEIREYANVLANFVKYTCPISYHAWLDYSFNAVKLSAGDMEVLKQLIYSNEDSIGSTGFELSLSDKLEGGPFEFSRLSSRERKEFFKKLSGEEREIPDLNEDEFMSPDQAQMRFEGKNNV